jgi:alkylation response protein AidB-like acyl-CoA dehydrogenase
MATAITTARLLTAHSTNMGGLATGPPPPPPLGSAPGTPGRSSTEAGQGADGDLFATMARVFATETALRVTLEAMRIHGGYGYTNDFPVERYYRDAPRLVLALGGNEAERHELGSRLVGPERQR